MLTPAVVREASLSVASLALPQPLKTCPIIAMARAVCIERRIESWRIVGLGSKH